MSTYSLPNADASSVNDRPEPPRRFPTTTGPTTSARASSRACAASAPIACDLLQVHMSPSRDQMEADHTVETMLALRDEGKIRFLGMSGTLPNLPDHLAMGAFDVFQVPYSALQREHEYLITEAAEAGAGTLIRGGAARGAPADDKAWQRGPIGLAEGEGQRRWESSGSRSSSKT